MPAAPRPVPKELATLILRCVGVTPPPITAFRALAGNGATKDLHFHCTKGRPSPLPHHGRIKRALKRLLPRDGAFGTRGALARAVGSGLDGNSVLNARGEGVDRVVVLVRRRVVVLLQLLIALR